MDSREIFAVHERPGKGIYRCVERPQWVVSLEEDSAPLPPCFGQRRFENVRYQRVVDLSKAVAPFEMQSL